MIPTVTQISSPPNYTKDCEEESRRANCPTHFHFRATLVSMVLIKLINYHTDCVCSYSLFSPSVWWTVENCFSCVSIHPLHPLMCCWKLESITVANVFSSDFFVVDVWTFPGGNSEFSCFVEKTKKRSGLHKNILSSFGDACLTTSWERGWMVCRES